MDNQSKWNRGMTYRQRAKIKAEANNIHEYWTFKEACMFFAFCIALVAGMIGLIYLNHITLGY